MDGHSSRWNTGISSTPRRRRFAPAEAADRPLRKDRKHLTPLPRLLETSCNSPASFVVCMQRPCVPSSCATARDLPGIRDASSKLPIILKILYLPALPEPSIIERAMRRPLLPQRRQTQHQAIVTDDESVKMLANGTKRRFSKKNICGNLDKEINITTA